MIDFFKLILPTTIWPIIKDVVSGIKGAKFGGLSEDEIIVAFHKFENLDVKVYRKNIELSGSIHTFHNRITGKSDDNRDDFSFDDFCQAIHILEQSLGLELQSYPLVQLEVGVNLRVDFHVKNFLRHNVLAWNFDRPIIDRDKQSKGHFKEFETSQFFIKTYDKGRQVDLPYEEMRFEFKYIRSHVLKQLGIYFLSDVLERSKFENLATDLFQRFNKDLLIMDSVELSFIDNLKDRHALTEGMNPIYWDRLLSEPSRFRRLSKPIHPTTIMRRKKHFLQLLEVYNLTNRKAQVMALLRDKIKQLTGVNLSMKRKVHKFSRITR